MKFKQSISRKASAVLISPLLIAATAFSQSASDTAQKPVVKQVTATSQSHRRYQPERFPKRARLYYETIWGVDSLTVKSVEAGDLIRFNYRVLDATRAVALNDKKAEPFLYDERSHVKLVVPSMEKVGKLRQSSPPVVGKVYWMAFSNKGGYVKPGDRVTVVIGNFHADGLVVQ